MEKDVLPLVEIKLNLIEKFLVRVLLNPFMYFICRPFRKVVSKIKRGGDSNTLVDQKVVNFGTVSVVAKVILCMVANLCLAAAIGTLNSINGSNKADRLVVMTIFGQVVASLVAFLGTESIPIYMMIIS